jgi:hypothetical protein
MEKQNGSVGASGVRFMRHYVTNGVTKARVHYFAHEAYGRNGELGAVVVLYAQDYRDSLYEMFGDIYQNNTEIQSDYFEKGHVVLNAAHPLYPAALTAAKAALAAREERWAKTQARRAAKREARDAAIGGAS